MRPAIVYLALGSNLEDRQANLEEAIRRLAEKVTVETLSPIYETEPAYVTDQPRFLNMVLRGQTALSPLVLLDFIKSIEETMGRVSGRRFGPRLIDVDILLYDELELDTPALTIPHPRMLERDFVLQPLADIAPQLVIPGQQEPIATLAQKTGNTGRVIRQVRDAMDLAGAPRREGKAQRTADRARMDDGR